MSDTERLIEALRDVRGETSMLACDIREAHRMLARGHEPAWYEYPRHESELRARLESMAPYPDGWAGEYGPNIEQELRTGWPGLLRRLSESLARWWASIDEANAALDAVPAVLVDHERTPAVDRWAAKRRLVLDRVAEPYPYTRPGVFHEQPNVSPVLHRDRGEQPPPQWPGLMGELAETERQLSALRGRGSEKAVKPQWITATQAHDLTGVDKGVISRAAASGAAFASRKEGRACWVDRDEFLRWAADRGAKQRVKDEAKREYQPESEAEVLRKMRSVGL